MNARSLLSDDEFRAVTQRSNVQASLMILFDYCVILFTFLLIALWPNPLMLVAGVLVIGGRQLALGVLVHEAGHKILFNSTSLNDWAGRWLAGYLIFSDKDGYMKVHLLHHRLAGTDKDPDLANYDDYPITRKRLWRKILRDVTGRVGIRRIQSIATATRRIAELASERRTFLLRSYGCNLVLLAILAFAGYAWLYLVWVVAFMTSHMLVSRIRQIGEHAAVPDHLSADARLNTRTIYVNWLERLILAPHRVSYHLEHHLLASVPSYRLPMLHRLLKEKGFYQNVDFPDGYAAMLRIVTHPTMPAHPA